METYLAHHGILGMKWGVRRYQNEDGTLTPAGKLRAMKVASSNYLSKRDTRIAKRAIYGTVKRNTLYADLNTSNAAKEIRKAAKAKSGGDEYGAQKHTSNAEQYVKNAANFIASNKALSKTLSEISDGTLKAGRDFFIQTDFDIGVLTNTITRTVIDVKE